MLIKRTAKTSTCNREVEFIITLLGLLLYKPRENERKKFVAV
jgi:hypothetical protein